MCECLHGSTRQFVDLYFRSQILLPFVKKRSGNRLVGVKKDFRIPRRISPAPSLQTHDQSRFFSDRVNVLTCISVSIWWMTKS